MSIPTTGITKKKIRPGYADTYDIRLTTEMVAFSVAVSTLQKGWKGSGEQDTLVKDFLRYNQRSFAFLKVHVVYSDDCRSLCFTTHELGGCAPLFSPISGKVYANLIVTGRFQEDVAEILPLVSSAVPVEFEDQLKLPYQSAVKPPLYYECARFIDAYQLALREHWHKFVNIQKIQTQPAASTNWERYAMQSYDPANTFRYPNRINRLTLLHPEWKQLNYVLSLCFKEIQNNAPASSRNAFRAKINQLQGNPITLEQQKTDKIIVHASDPMVIKSLKVIAIRILSSISIEYRAWRLNYGELFERYVQYVMSETAKRIGATALSNAKFSVTGDRMPWDLPYIEPDVLLRKEDIQIVADAKYKNNMRVLSATRDGSIHEEFRHDMHQVLAYASFSGMRESVSILVYPATHYRCLHQTIRSSGIVLTNHLYLVGIPYGRCTEDVDSELLLPATAKAQLAIKGLSEILKDL